MTLAAATIRRLRRLCGKKFKRQTTVKCEFKLFTPCGYFDPETDEVLHVDLIDAIERHVTEFHDVPGFRIRSYQINGREIL